MKKSYSSVLLFIIAFASPAIAEQNSTVTVKFDQKSMCLFDGKVFSLGSKIVVNNDEMQCLNARPEGGFIDRDYPARWVSTSKIENHK